MCHCETRQLHPTVPYRTPPQPTDVHRLPCPHPCLPPPYVPRCLVCGDPLLLSIRRSGRRYADPVLPFDESSRQLSVALPFGTQLPEFFDEAEDFRVVSPEGATPLNASSRACHQGMQVRGLGAEEVVAEGLDGG